MDVLIVVICTLFAAGLLALVIYQAIQLHERVKAEKVELARIKSSEKYILDIIQNGRTVRVECTDVNCDNVELLSSEDKED